MSAGNYCNGMLHKLMHSFTHRATRISKQHLVELRVGSPLASYFRRYVDTWCAGHTRHTQTYESLLSAAQSTSVAVPSLSGTGRSDLLRPTSQDAALPTAKSVSQWEAQLRSVACTMLPCPKYSTMRTQLVCPQAPNAPRPSLSLTQECHPLECDAVWLL
jgi:hypothetical protein